MPRTIGCDPGPLSPLLREECARLVALTCRDIGSNIGNRYGFGVGFLFYCRRVTLLAVIFCLTDFKTDIFFNVFFYLKEHETVTFLGLKT